MAMRMTESERTRHETAVKMADEAIATKRFRIFWHRGTDGNCRRDVRLELDGRYIGLLGGLDQCAKVLRSEHIEDYARRITRLALIDHLFCKAT